MLSIGLLGLASLQAWGLRATGNATYRSQATLLAQDMIERIRGNLPGVTEGAYRFTAIDCDVLVNRCMGVGVCTPDQVATADYFGVMCGAGADGGVRGGLPNGSMTVECNPGALCTINLTWRELADQGSDGEARESSLRLDFKP